MSASCVRRTAGAPFRGAFCVVGRARVIGPPRVPERLPLEAILAFLASPF